jgi:hypothetical protein
VFIFDRFALRAEVLITLCRSRHLSSRNSSTFRFVFFPEDAAGELSEKHVGCPPVLAVVEDDSSSEGRRVGVLLPVFAAALPCCCGGLRGRSAAAHAAPSRREESAEGVTDRPSRGHATSFPFGARRRGVGGVGTAGSLRTVSPRSSSGLTEFFEALRMLKELSRGMVPG